MSARRPYVIGPESASKPSKRVGGKAAALFQLADVFPVPRFFVITPDAFSERGLKTTAGAQLAPAIAALGSGPFAVRSSARDEDGSLHAHAGQYLTELDVPAQKVPEAAMRVWLSGFTETVLLYRAARGLDDKPHAPAIIVQRMLKPRSAGVAFSACPVTGDRGLARISAVAGCSDRLASGDIDGDGYAVHANGSVSSERGADLRVLSDTECRAIAEMARSCEALFGAPQDIEWAIADETLYLLQSRPITTLGEENVTVWDNSNIVESYPGVVSPLTYSFARYVYNHVYRAFARLMGVSATAIARNSQAFDEMLGCIEGRVYYNLLNWYRILALFPGFKSNRAFMEQMMGVAEALPADLAARIAPPVKGVWPKLMDSARLVRVAIGLAFHAATLQPTIAKFRARLDVALQPANAAIDEMDAKCISLEYKRVERLLLQRWDAPLINDFLCMIAFGASRRVLEAWAGPEGLRLHGDVMIGQGDIVSAEPARRVSEMGAIARRTSGLVEQLAAGYADLGQAPELAAAIDTYVARFGDRCVQELKLESVSLDVDRTPLLFSIAAAATAPERKCVRERIRPDVRLKTLFPNRPLKRVVASWLLQAAKARVRDRENLRFDRTRLFGRARRLFNALGRRLADAGHLDEPRDIFYLTIEEALAAVEGGNHSQLKALAVTRKAEHETYRACADPPERIVANGARLTPSTEPQETGQVRSGLACCAGVVTARVRIILDPRIETLSPGEILVARSTDPGWIAAFASASGVIAERGSLLSHSAIVAREMGVPCIVGLKSATTWLRTGDLVRLDGGVGSVERLSS